ncbi:MAG: hypothetical protein A2163_04010 [Actinobacteria bacterium RBG_13_35_12]|nr:MAG: hypothetical protein A2163_04010 [Actinobacteria bacterium RBG_13_35_12]
MVIRIGDSCCKSIKMITPQSRVVEARRFLIYPTEWYGISVKCIAEKKFLILTLCIGRNDKLEYMPSESQWRNFIEDSVLSLISVGGNRVNSRIDIVNEPTKYCTKEQYTWLVNIAHSQIAGRLKMGAGCEELNFTEFYQYLSSHGNFEVLVIHIQGACSDEQKTSYYTNIAKNLAVSYKREIDCNEACYSNVATSDGFSKLKMQLKYAEKIGCSNFCNVFNDLDRSAFSQDTSKWDFLCFKINGKLRSGASANYNEWIGLMNSKAPIPNIVPLPIIEEEDMKLKVLQIGSKGNQVKWLQQILKMEYEFENTGGYDGKFGTITDIQVREYQIANGETVDGKVGKDTTTALIVNAGNYYSPEYWKTKLQVYMAYE